MLLRPLSIGEILDAGINVLRKAGGPIVAVGAAVYLPSLALMLAFGSISPLAARNERGLLAGLLVVVVWLVGGLVTRLFAIAITSGLIHETPKTIVEHAKFVRGTLLGVASQRLMYWAGVGGASLLFVIPGLWLAVQWSAALPALLIESTGPGSSLKRSFQLVQRGFGATVGWTITLMTMAFAAYLAVAAGVELVGLSDNAAFVVNAVTAYVTSVLIWSLVGTSQTVLLVDLKVRQEGYDIDLIRKGLTATNQSESLRSIDHGAHRPRTTPSPVWQPPS